MRPPQALVVRGPTGTGKSTAIGHCLQTLSQTGGQVVSLDDGWRDPARSGQPERRFSAQSAAVRYADLVGRTEDPLVIELGWGEPEGATFHGSTKNPREWIDLLQAQGRNVVLVRLSGSWTEVQKRIVKRYTAQGIVIPPNYPFTDERDHYDKIEYDSARVDFPLRSRLTEIVIPTDHRPSPDIAREILHHCR